MFIFYTTSIYSAKLFAVSSWRVHTNYMVLDLSLIIVKTPDFIRKIRSDKHIETDPDKLMEGDEAVPRQEER